MVWNSKPVPFIEVLCKGIWWQLFVLRWGGKVVRGAYMQYEQARAASLDLTSPLHPTYQLTNMAYDRSVPTGSNGNPSAILQYFIWTTVAYSISIIIDLL